MSDYGAYVKMTRSRQYGNPERLKADQTDIATIVLNRLMENITSQLRNPLISERVLAGDEINMQWARSVMPADLPAPKRPE